MDPGPPLGCNLKDVKWSAVAVPLDLLVSTYRLPQIARLDSGAWGGRRGRAGAGLRAGCGTRSRERRRLPRLPERSPGAPAAAFCRGSPRSPRLALRQNIWVMFSRAPSACAEGSSVEPACCQQPAPLRAVLAVPS